MIEIAVSAKMTGESGAPMGSWPGMDDGGDDMTDVEAETRWQYHSRRRLAEVIIYLK